MNNQLEARLQVDRVLTFWFGKSDSSNYGKPKKEWFTKDTAFDEEVRLRFFSDYELAASGKLDYWQKYPESCLALIILLDQLPRNLFRGKPEAFATDSKALTAAQYAVDNKFDSTFLPIQRWFIYLPFEHSENLEHQRKAVELFHQLSGDADSKSPIDYAIRHLEIIEKFGRFPHRNQILGRETTPEEAEFIKQPGSGF